LFKVRISKRIAVFSLLSIIVLGTVGFSIQSAYSTGGEITCTNFQLTDSFGAPFPGSIPLGQIMFSADLANNHDHNQDFGWTVGILDSTNVQISLVFLSGNLNPAQAFSPPKRI